MSSSHHFTTMSLEQAKNNCRKMVTQFLTYFILSQNVSGKASLYLPELPLYKTGLSSDPRRKRGGLSVSPRRGCRWSAAGEADRPSDS